MEAGTATERVGHIVTTETFRGESRVQVTVINPVTSLATVLNGTVMSWADPTSITIYEDVLGEVTIGTMLREVQVRNLLDYSPVYSVRVRVMGKGWVAMHSTNDEDEARSMADALADMRSAIEVDIHDDLGFTQYHADGPSA